jgi:hypothetical protein
MFQVKKRKGQNQGWGFDFQQGMGGQQQGWGGQQQGWGGQQQ